MYLTKEQIILLIIVLLVLGAIPLCHLGILLHVYLALSRSLYMSSCRIITGVNEGRLLQHNMAMSTQQGRENALK